MTPIHYFRENEKFLLIASLSSILLISFIPWGVEYYETGTFFLDRQFLIADVTATLLNVLITLLVAYFFIQRSRLHQQRTSELQRLSFTDHLTQIYNSRFFHEQLTRDLDRAERQNGVLSLIFLDIDGFKNYNDSQGHAAGDDLLKEVGSIIRRTIRQGVDCGARYGGDEFSVILIDSDLKAAYEIGERIRLAFHREAGSRASDRAAGSRTSGRGWNGAISLSLGIASFRKGDSADCLLKRADDAMYRAKKKGGNQIEMEYGAVPMKILRYGKTV